MSKRYFIGGPWDGHITTYPSPVPSKCVKVFAPAATAAVCDDEQVTKLLGHYDRLGRWRGFWHYLWRTA